MSAMSQPPDPPATLFGRQTHHVPPGTGTFGMALFLAALGMLFAASIIGYLWMRLGFAHAPPSGAVDLPWPLWLSTFLILVSSFTLHRAVQNVRHERQSAFRNALLATCLLATAFLLVQAPALADLLREHWPKVTDYMQTLRDAREQAALAGARIDPADPRLAGKLPVEGLVFAMILLHALHVLGGIIPLGVITVQANRGRYDHEQHAPVRHLAMYWHFLDAVWIVLFATLLLAG